MVYKWSIGYCIKRIEEELRVMERALNSHKTIPELALNSRFHGAESSYLTFFQEAEKLGVDVGQYVSRHEVILRRFERLTEVYVKKIYDKAKINKTLEYDLEDSNEDYMPKVIKTNNFIRY